MLWNSELMLFGFEIIANRLFRRFDISLLYENKYGIKCFNQLITSDSFPFYRSSSVFELPSEQLFVGFDGLKDKYTLINACIINSPHFDLVSCLSSENKVELSSYVQKAAKGTLDFRNFHFEQYLQSNKGY